MQANRVPEHEISEKEQGHYHLKLVKNIHIPKENRYEKEEIIAIMSVKDYKNFKKPGMMSIVGIDEATILHDPTFKGKTEDETKTEQPEAETIKPTDPAPQEEVTQPKESLAATRKTKTK